MQAILDNVHLQIINGNVSLTIRNILLFRSSINVFFSQFDYHIDILSFEIVFYSYVRDLMGSPDKLEKNMLINVEFQISELVSIAKTATYLNFT